MKTDFMISVFLGIIFTCYSFKADSYRNIQCDAFSEHTWLKLKHISDKMLQAVHADSLLSAYDELRSLKPKLNKEFNNYYQKLNSQVKTKIDSCGQQIEKLIPFIE